MTSSPRRPGFAVGAITVLVILVVVCLSTLAVSSLAGANADSLLGQSGAQYLTEYYQAETCCWQQIAQADQLLCKKADLPDESWAKTTASALTEEGWQCQLTQSGDLLISRTELFGEDQAIVVQLLALRPSALSAGEGYYTTQGFYTTNLGDWQPDDTLPVYGTSQPAP